MTARISEAAPRHAPEIAALERVCFGADAWAEDVVLRWISGGDKLFLVCEDERGAVLGYIGAQTVLDEGYIGNVAVAPRARRQGVGGALIGALVGRARETGLSFLTLEVREGNAPARALYAACGFAEVGRRKGYYDGPREDAVLMTRYL